MKLNFLLIISAWMGFHLLETLADAQQTPDAQMLLNLAGSALKSTNEDSKFSFYFGNLLCSVARCCFKADLCLCL